MITDKIENAEKYFCVHPYFKEAFEKLAEINDSTADGRIDIDGENAHIGLSSNLPKNPEECRFECHRKYIDIQFVVKGHERIDIADEKALEAEEDYMGRDIAFYKAPESFSSCDLKDGYFAVIFPGEAHRPCVKPLPEAVKTRKAVVKIIY